MLCSVTEAVSAKCVELATAMIRRLRASAFAARNEIGGSMTRPTNTVRMSDPVLGEAHAHRYTTDG